MSGNLPRQAGIVGLEKGGVTRSQTGTGTLQKLSTLGAILKADLSRSNFVLREYFWRFS
jgi:hypothetical protein